LRAVDVRDADPRYQLLTPAQWASLLMIAGASYLLYRAAASGAVGTEPFRLASTQIDPAALHSARAKRARSGPPEPGPP
jgi:hypothetical protein